MTGKSPFGYLDRLRENLETLDEQIALASKNSKSKGGLQWAKLTRDLIAERNATMEKVKGHLLGRSEVGTIREPDDVYEGNPEVEFERAFQSLLTKPWSKKDLELECEDCGVESEEVQARVDNGNRPDLCNNCYAKREEAAKIPECMVCHVKDDTVKKHTTPGNWLGGMLVGVHEFMLCCRCWEDMRQGKPPNPEPPDGNSPANVTPDLGRIDLSTAEKCKALIEHIKGLEAAGRLEAEQARVMIQAVNNALELHKRAG